MTRGRSVSKAKQKLSASRFPAPIAPRPRPMPPQDRRRLNHAGEIEQVRPQPRQPHQQRAIAAPKLKTCRSSPQGDIELMTEKEDLGFKPAPRLEQIGDKSCKQAEDRKHRMQ